MPRELARLFAFVFYVALVAVAPSPSPSPIVYRPVTWDDIENRTLSDGAYGTAAAKSPTGPAIDGFALSLTANRYTFRMGDGLSFAVELRNVSGVAKSSPFSSKEASYDFTIRNAKTNDEVSTGGPSHFGPPAAYEFPPNTSLYLSFLPQITDKILEPGTYHVQAATTQAGQTLRSNVVTLNVLPSADGTPYFGLSDPSLGGPAGVAVEGIALAVSAPQALYRLGSPIWIYAELRNTTPDFVNVRFDWRGLQEFALVDRPNGRPIPAATDPQALFSAFRGPFGFFSMQKGRSHFFAIRLDRLFQISSPGTYAFKMKMSLSGRHMPQRSPFPDFKSIALASNAVAVTVLPARSPTGPSANGSVYQGPPGDSVTGPSSHGVALALTNDWPSSAVAAPIIVKLELRNVSGHAQHVFFGSIRHDYEFRVINRQTGKPVTKNSDAVFPREVSSVPWNSRPLYPDTSLYSTLWLDRFYRFANTGEYSITVIGRPMVNALRVTLRSNPLYVHFTAAPPTMAMPKSEHALRYSIQTDRDYERLRSAVGDFIAGLGAGAGVMSVQGTTICVASSKNSSVASGRCRAPATRSRRTFRRLVRPLRGSEASCNRRTHVDREVHRSRDEAPLMRLVM